MSRIVHTSGLCDCGKRGTVKLSAGFSCESCVSKNVVASELTRQAILEQRGGNYDDKEDRANERRKIHWQTIGKLKHA